MPDVIKVIDHTRPDDATIRAPIHGSTAQAHWHQFSTWEAPYRSEPEPDAAQDVAWAGDTPCAYVAVALALCRGARFGSVTWAEFLAAAAILHHPAAPTPNRTRARGLLYAFADAPRSWVFAREAAHRMADELRFLGRRPDTGTAFLRFFEVTLDAHLHANACEAVARGTGDRDWERVSELASAVHQDGRRILSSAHLSLNNRSRSPLTPADVARVGELRARCVAVDLIDTDVFTIGDYADGR